MQTAFLKRSLSSVLMSIIFMGSITQAFDVDGKKDNDKRLIIFSTSKRIGYFQTTKSDHQTFYFEKCGITRDSKKQIVSDGNCEKLSPAEIKNTKSSVEFFNTKFDSNFKEILQTEQGQYQLILYRCFEVSILSALGMGYAALAARTGAVDDLAFFAGEAGPWFIGGAILVAAATYFTAPRSLVKSVEVSLKETSGIDEKAEQKRYIETLLKHFESAIRITTEEMFHEGGGIISM